MKIDILTIFPDFFRGPLDHGILRRAREAGLVEVAIHDLRAITTDRHKTVDDRPFGGGEGMVLKPEPIFETLESLGLRPAERRGAADNNAIVLLSAQGKLFRQAMAEEFSQLSRLVLICGRYEGVDERVSEFIADREVSVGDYVLTGGELAAAIIADAVVRLLPGALGNEASARQESFSSAVQAGGLGKTADPRYTEQSATAVAPGRATSGPSSTCASGGLLDYPHYTRPADYRGMKVPEVLVSGNHTEIRRWRRRKSLEKTLRNRPDLLERVALSSEDRELIAQIVAEMRK
ncbi:MAG TPA: tRNA (guanosine(37)-N1)-methyltransferase TrmD [Terriglobales bacterium]|nr:tRNA (guanosine(37)-N1)-methyltransferase TrmD [Terriglobales bacterium]